MKCILLTRKSSDSSGIENQLAAQPLGEARPLIHHDWDDATHDVFTCNVGDDDWDELCGLASRTGCLLRSATDATTLLEGVGLLLLSENSDPGLVSVPVSLTKDALAKLQQHRGFYDDDKQAVFIKFAGRFNSESALFEGQMLYEHGESEHRFSSHEVMHGSVDDPIEEVESQVSEDE